MTEFELQQCLADCLTSLADTLDCLLFITDEDSEIEGWINQIELLSEKIRIRYEK